MPRVSEQELFCSTCGKTKRLPFCCGKTMQIDKHLFFCETCGKETQFPVCCNESMVIRKKVLDLKKQIFGQY
jgi:hypothetical protein